MKVLIGIVLLAGLIGSSAEKKVAPEPPIDLDSVDIDSVVEFRAFQRSTTALPKSDGRILITLDDITRGQTRTSLSWKKGGGIVAVRSLKVNDIVSFEVNGYSYKLELHHLRNKLVGNDSATFRIWADTPEMTRIISVNKSIQDLIFTMLLIPEATFIRNGKEYGAFDAALHLERKWKANRSKVKTVDDFITIVATKSSITGKPYLIRMADGTEVETAKWFKGDVALWRKYLKGAAVKENDDK